MLDLVVVQAATGRQHHATGGAREQAHLQVSFQAGDVLAHGGGTQTQATGATGNAAGFDNLDETLDRTEQVHGRLPGIRKIFFIKT
ncbi:hypothetical protein D3C86_2055210 [compost metagenome]